jgi:uncharacterized protein YecT (DUF1311 family)
MLLAKSGGGAGSYIAFAPGRDGCSPFSPRGPAAILQTVVGLYRVVKMRTLLVIAMISTLLMFSSVKAQLSSEDAGDRTQAPKAVKSIRNHPTSKGPPALALPAVEAVIGRDLLLGGANGLLRLSGQAGALQIERFSMSGEVISDPKQQCRIDVVGETAILTKDLGRPDGLQRFAAEIPACPFEFDVLNEAVLVSGQLQACVFKAADCQANPAGLWGPDRASLTTDAKVKKGARANAEATMSAIYQALASRLNDQSKVDALTDEQSRFLSIRDETCRAYSHEDEHGFCAVRLTEARATLLKARLDELPQSASLNRNSKQHRRKAQ